MDQERENPVAGAATRPEPTVEVRGLAFAYDPARPVLRGLDMEAGAGRLVAVLGPNGSGKTTLLKLLARLLRPSGGEIEIEGRPIGKYRAAELARRLAYVPQETTASVAFTAMETVLTGRSPHTGAMGFEAPEDRAIAREAMRLTEAETFADRTLDELSGGERQRVVIARALAQEPRVLLLDEPTSFLDIKHQHGIYALLRRLAEERGLTVLCVSHDLNLAAAYADEMVLLARGKVAAAGTPENVLRADVLSRVYETPVEVRTDEAIGRPFVVARPKS